MKRRRDYLLLLPAFVLSMAVVFIPGVMTIFASFTDWNGVSMNFHFIGLRNFSELFGDKIFWRAIYDNVRWVALFLTIPVVIGLVTSVLLLNRRHKGLYQMLFLFPYVLAPVTNVAVWQNIIYNPIFGLVGYLNRQGFHIPSLLRDMKTALYAVAATDIWHYWGFLMVVYLASLRQTPEDQVEAARVEGCSGWQLFRYVYFPNMLPTFKLMMIMSVINSFLTYDYVYLMTSGGPAHSTEMLSTYAYTFAFASLQVGKAAAIALFMSFFGLIASFVYIHLSQNEIMS